jgi:hypothetical protein
MSFSQFIILILIFYGIYYSVILLIDFFRNNGKAIAGTGNSPHALSFEVQQQPVNVAALTKTEGQYQSQDVQENYFIKEQVTKPVQKNNSTIVVDLGLEILSNGIDISAENLAILLS